MTKISKTEMAVVLNAKLKLDGLVREILAKHLSVPRILKMILMKVNQFVEMNHGIVS